MTRFARAGKRKFLEASTWEDMSSDLTLSESNMAKKESSSKNKKIDMKTKKKEGEIGMKEKEINPKRQKQIEARRRRRRKWKCCFVCRQPGHQASDCPNKDEMKIGTCFKCGSADHTTRKCENDTSTRSSGPFPFAKCFICQEMGHLARSCPENPRGLYPQGGGCKICGSVEHLKRDCPQLQKKKNKKGHIVEDTVAAALEPSVHCSTDAQEHSEENMKKFRMSKLKIVHF